MNEDKKMSISIVIPLFNEEKSLPILYKQIMTSLNLIGETYEIIFIDDGSSDNSLFILKGFRQENKNLKIIQFRKNFGKSAALNAGFKQSRGEVILTMDADLQDDPSEFSNFLQKLKEGFDLISGWKVRRHDPLSKVLPSRVFNWVTSLATGINIHDFNCGFKCYRREVIEAVDVYGELHRYIPVLAAWKGFKIGEIKVKHRPRQFGKSKFGTGRFFKGLFDFITIIFLTKYSKRPLHFFGIPGMLVSGIGFLICLFLSLVWFSGQKIGHRPLLLLGILLIILGVHFVSLGLIGEMITSKFPDRSKDYLIKQKFI